MKKLAYFLFPFTITDLVNNAITEANDDLQAEREYNRQLLKEKVALQRKVNDLEAQLLQVNRQLQNTLTKPELNS